MIIGTCIITLHAEWVASLKEKRMVVKSIIEKTRNKFNVSIAEISQNDCHKTIVIGFACVTNERAHADTMVEKIILYIENNTDAAISQIDKEIL